MSYMRNTLPLALKTPIWKDFCDAWDEELLLFKDEILKKKDIYITDALSDEELVIYLRDFGYSPNRLLDNSSEFLKKEIKTLLYKIRNKTTYSIYDYFFRLVGLKGRVLNYFYDSFKLVEAVDIKKTIDVNLVNHINKSKFFYGLEPILNFNQFLDLQLMLDSTDPEFNMDLDADIPWYLDEDVNKFVTKHLSIDIFPKEIIIKDDKEYLFTIEMSLFINDIADYNKKAVEVPHVGLNLFFINSNTGIYNHWSQNTYSIPDLKINSSITSVISTYNPTFLLALDTEDGLDNEMDLDRDITWSLDNESIPPTPESIFQMFYYICAGFGRKSFIRDTYFDELTDPFSILGLWDFDKCSNLDDNIFTDYSRNNRDLTVIGNEFSNSEGIISGKSLEFFGIDTYAEVSTFIVDVNIFTLNFWVDFNDNQISDSFTILETGFLSIDYNNLLKELYVTINDGVNFVTSIIDYTNYLDINTMITIKFRLDENLCDIFLNGIVIDSLDVSSIVSVSGTTFIRLASDSLLTDFYKGKIDEIRFYNKVLNDETIEYLFTNKIGNIASSLDKEYFCEPISQGELFQNTALYHINTLVKANFVKNQRVLRSDGITETYTGFLQSPLPIKGRTVEIKYTSGLDNHIAVDDGSGKLQSLVGNFIDGNIDYITGEYNLTFYGVVSVVNTFLDDNTSTVSALLDYENIVPGSFKLYYEIGVTSYTTFDNGAGAITGTSITSGSINYDTGVVDIVFDLTANNINCDYSYKNYAIPNDKSLVNINYELDKILPITEVGIKNMNGDLVCYTTFPDVEMDNQDHISTQFIIYK